MSSLLLIEDSADSEEQYPGFFSLCPSSIAAKTGDNEDDGESCCNCDSTDTASICGLPKDGAGNKDDHGIGEFCGGEEDESYECDGGNPTLWMSIEALEDEAETRNGEVNVNELEDRLFWEMCMAVGYP